MTRIRLARVLAVCTVLFGIAFYAIGAAIKPGYSSVRQYVSELNASGTAWAQELGLLGFLPLGLLFAAFLLAAAPRAEVRGASRLGWLLLWSQPLSLIAVVFAPCDAGCPVEGSALQALHNLQGVLAYFATSASLVLLSFAPPLRGHRVHARYFLRIAGAMFVVVFMLMLAAELAPIHGALQRLGDGFLAASLLLIAWQVVVPDARAAVCS